MLRLASRSFFLILLSLLVFALPAAAQGDKKTLNHSVYDDWKSIRSSALSSDGEWVQYSLVPGDGESVLQVINRSADREFKIERGRSGTFSYDSRFVVAMISPPEEAVEQAKKDGKKGKDLPKSALGILNLQTGALTRIKDVKSFRLPEEGATWLAYLKESDPKDKPERKSEPADKDSKKDEKKKKSAGSTLVLRRLATGEEVEFEFVVRYVFDQLGQQLAFARSTTDGKADGVFLVAEGGEARELLGGEGHYRSLTFDEDGKQLAFLTDRDDYEADPAPLNLYHWKQGDEQAQRIAESGNERFEQGWWISENRGLRFSKAGRRLIFGTAPAPEPEPEEDEEVDEDEVELDVWSWKDPYLQPQQLVQVQQERMRSYLAIAQLDGDQGVELVQLGSKRLPSVRLSEEGDGNVALAISDLPYRQMSSWDYQVYRDLYILDARSGQVRINLPKVRDSRTSLSPDGRFLTWWDYDKQHWFAMDTASGEVSNLSAGIPHPVYNELHDAPSLASPYGSGGWLARDQAFLIYDRYDIWLVNPRRNAARRCLTEGIGRRRGIRFRHVDLDLEEPAIDPTQPMLLSAFHLKNKNAGFFRDSVSDRSEPQELLWEAQRFGFPRKAELADRLMYTRESYQDFPDLWTSDLDLGDRRRMSWANPQKEEYHWGTVELTEWDSTDGERLQGLLYKPDGFDPARKYPLMTYFYERNSDTMHQHRPPVPHRSIISISFYVSRGYVVFVPDIPYRVGYPGDSAMAAVVPGVEHLLAQGYVDRERVGVQGHSWGGYQIAYMVTKTNLFACAEAGAPVSNMTSAYGGIRWASGRSRMFQYEKTQSRLGATLWDNRELYLLNSPLFFADRVKTPLLMMHNDEDGAVPWYQGIEYFVALRRLGKPAWLLNYNGEQHGLIKYVNKKDWAVRMQQFFDHYLMDAPEPKWMSEGIPAIEKGKTLGLELPPPVVD